MTHTCQAITTPARGAHRCRNAHFADGWCQAHHPVLRLGRLGQKRARLQKALEQVTAEIHAIERGGHSATDLPGQLRFEATA